MGKTPTNERDVGASSSSSIQDEDAQKLPITPTTDELAETPNWGQGGRYVINPQGERVPATDKD